MNKGDYILRVFGNRLRTLRIKRGITSQMELANKAGLDRTYVGGIERGERNVSLINIIKLAAALNIDPADLFKS